MRARDRRVAGNRCGDRRADCGLRRVRTTYIANPDLVERFATGAPLAEVGWETVYGSGTRGYSDCPAIRRAAGE